MSLSNFVHGSVPSTLTMPPLPQFGQYQREFHLVGQDLIIQHEEFRQSMPFFSQSSCERELIGGTLASIFTRNPIPMLIGLCQCVSNVFAQQKVGSEFQVNTYTTHNQGFPSVTSQKNGNFVVTWQSYDQDGSGDGIYGQLFDGNATKIGSEFQINTFTNNSQWNPSVTSLKNSSFIVTWESYLQDGDWFGIFGQLFNANASRIGNEFQVNTVTFNDQAMPSIAALSNESFVVVWADYRNGTGSEIYGQLFEDTGSKIGSDFKISSYFSNWKRLSSVANLSNGNFVVVWEAYASQDGDKFGIFGQLFLGNSSRSGNEFQVNTYTTHDQVGPSVTGLNNGNFVVTWESYGQDGFASGIFGQLFDGNGAKIGNEFQINEYTTSSQGAPSVASWMNGNFVVTWESDGQDGSGHGIYGQLFDENGNKNGPEFRANTYTPNYQRFPSVASFSNDNFVVTWISDGQDGNRSGIFGQIFERLSLSSTTSTTVSSSSTTCTTVSSSSVTSTTVSSSSTTSTTSTSTTSQPRTSVNPSSSTSVNSTSTTTSSKSSSTTLIPSSKTSSPSSSTSSTTSQPRTSVNPSSSTSVNSTSTTTSSKSSSTTLIPSSKTSSPSSSTSSTTSQPRTSVNPSSSISVNSTIKPSTFFDINSKINSTSDPSNRFSWLWFLLGSAGGVICSGITGYLFFLLFKSRNKKKDSDVHAFALGERKQTEDSTAAEPHYQRTPDFVTERAGQEPIYGRTPDFVTERAGQEPIYGRTPDFVTEQAGQGPIYGRTPDFVTEVAGKAD